MRGKILKSVTAILKSHNKALKWMDTPNPNFGDLTPNQMLGLGRSRKVYEFVKDGMV